MGEDFGWASPDHVVAVTAVEMHGGRHGNIDRITTGPGPAPLRGARLDLGAIAGTRSIEGKAPTDESVHPVTPYRRRKRKTGDTDAQTANGDPAKVPNHGHLPALLGRGAHSAGGRTGRAGAPRNRSSTAAARRRRHQR